MEEQPSLHQPPQDAGGPQGNASSSARRRVVLALFGLYAVSALAAFSLLLRAPEPTAARRPPILGGNRFLPMREPGVAWVSIHGPIYGSSSGRSWERGVEQWTRRIRTLGDRSDVKAIILDINSPGGSVGSVQELSRAIERVREEKKKPVVAVVGDVCASGGYWLAAISDKIVAHPGSLVGSIGVIFETMNAQQLMNKIGVRVDPVKSGKMKDIGSPARAMTPEERALLQNLINDSYLQFLDVVSKGRRIPIGVLKPMADGRVFTGQQALKLGLIDALGDSQDALMLAGKLAGISGKPRIIRESESFDGFLEMLGSGAVSFLHPEAALIEQLRPLMSNGLEYRWSGF